MDPVTLQPNVADQAPVVATPVAIDLPPAGTGVSIPEKTLTEREIGYTINDKYFSGFEVVKTTVGWWKDRDRVVDLIKCFKQGYTIKQACIMTGITIDQYKHFVIVHPVFSAVREACEEVGKMMVETNIHEFLMDKDKETTRWFAERRIPEKYGRNLAMGEGGAPVINNFGTIINAPAQNVPASVAARIKGQ